MIKRPPGVEDIFPDRIDTWRHIENSARDCFRTHNYREIIIPIMEFTEVFSRGLGDTTDIVTKEMFTFEDRGGRNLTLRPEGTASVVRAYVENGNYNRLSTCKLFYCGQMFRAERPQRGRLRQFNQFGAEFFGSDDPYYDAEIITIMDTITRRVGIDDYTLLLNSIGCKECRPPYIAKLKEYYLSNKTSLCEDCIKRIDKNPLRLLDCKEESCSNLKPDAPKISQHLCQSCEDHYGEVKRYLNDSKVTYTEDPYLVRGLDYYVKTTFEFTTTKLGAQNAFAGGGRYDGLVEQFEGKPTPAVGFAAGMERIALLLEGAEPITNELDAFIIHTGGEALTQTLDIASELRTRGCSVDFDPETKGFKSQFKRADREKAKFAIIIGEDEVKNGSFALKTLSTGEQITCTREKLLETISH